MKMYRNYYLLLASQFLSAYGDNAILAVILGQLTFLKQHGEITGSQLSMANGVYTSLLFVPYVLLAPLAGYLNDRYAKTRWLLGGNLIKVLGTGIAMTSVWFGPVIQGVGYLIVGVGSCIYSPAKYGVLPEVLPRERLVKANGTVEFLTLVAILTGMIGGAFIIDKLDVKLCYFIVLAIFGSSLLLNCFMTETPTHPEVKLSANVGEFFGNFKELLSNRRLLRVLCGTGIFWVSGAVMKMNFQPWGLEVLGLKTNTQISLLGLWLSVGIMAGSVLAGQLYRVGDLRATRQHGWTLAGLVASVGLVEAFRLAGWWPPGPWLVILQLMLTGMAAGLFLIPLNAALQSECNQSKLGKTIATQNFVDNLGMVGSGAFVVLGAKHGMSPSGIFLALSVLLALVVTALRVPPKTGTETAASEAPAASAKT